MALATNEIEAWVAESHRTSIRKLRKENAQLRKEIKDFRASFAITSISY